MQTKINDWDIVNSQIDRSNVKRINWKAIFGKTIPDLVHEYNNKGYDSENTYKILKSKLILMSIDEPKILKNLKISICSRYAEQNMMKKRGII